MKVKLVNAATFVYKGRIYHKGEIFEIDDKELAKYRFILQTIESPKKKDEKAKQAIEDSKKNRKKKGED